MTKTYLFYDLKIDINTPNTNNIIGKTKYEINLESLSKLPTCYHNEDAFKYMLNKYGWARNYISDIGLTVFDCHVIDYVIDNVIDNVIESESDLKTEKTEKTVVKVHILFFSLKEELLIPNIIKNDNSIITILNRHIMIYNNITNIDYHNYQIDLLCKELSKDRILDLRFRNKTICKTQLYNYQLDNIQWMINIEHNLPIINFTEHKIINLQSISLYFDYNAPRGANSACDYECFIPYDKLPKCTVKGGIICDETGLGKTVQMLSLAFSYMELNIKTLIIVPNHIKKHWQNELLKHFDIEMIEQHSSQMANILIVSFIEFSRMDITLIRMYNRLIVDEIHELYALAKSIENSKIFNKIIEECAHFTYRWGITATPFIDGMAMLNIIKFLLGIKIYNPAVGNYIMIQEQIKSVFHKNTKLNVEYELTLPDIEIINILLDFNKYERDIYNAEMLGNENRDIQFLREVCVNPLIAICDDNVITTSELKHLTLHKFLDKVHIAQKEIETLYSKKTNIERELIILSHRGTVSDEILCNASVINASVISEYEQRIRHIDSNINEHRKILQRRIDVYESYKYISDNIEKILENNDDDTSNGNTSNGDAIGIDETLNPDKMCSICYSPFSEKIALYIVCRHYFCISCFKKCNEQHPNKCPMCRSPTEQANIHFIGSKCNITSTKNVEILRLIKGNANANIRGLKEMDYDGMQMDMQMGMQMGMPIGMAMENQSSERFIIFTQFDKLITTITKLLCANDIAALTYKEFASASQEVKDATQVIILSSTANASGIDLSFIHNVIIMEPFENYIYGKEIEKQLIGRVHRINQIHKVNVYRLIIKNTIEEEIYSLSM